MDCSELLRSIENISSPFKLCLLNAFYQSIGVTCSTKHFRHVEINQSSLKDRVGGSLYLSSSVRKSDDANSECM